MSTAEQIPTEHAAWKAFQENGLPTTRAQLAEVRQLVAVAETPHPTLPKRELREAELVARAAMDRNRRLIGSMSHAGTPSHETLQRHPR